MITETKEVYKCEHCRKMYQVKRFAEFHEQCCTKNPANRRACFGCIFLQKKRTIISHDSPMGGEYEQPLDLLYCPKKETFLYPPKVEVKGNFYDLGDASNEPMPNECEFKHPQSEC